jgi:hypothetical protein
MTKLDRLLTLASVAAFTIQAQTAAKPLEPVSAIVEACRTYEIVALGNVEFRGNEQSHALQLSLIRDLRLAAVVNDIVVEFGSARHQDVVDRFVRGEAVPAESLRRVWQDTTQVEFEWDFPIYEDFFRAVREVNALLPAARRLRVLLGDPPIDWSAVRTFADLRSAMGDRDAHAADVIRRGVLAKGRRALVIYGGAHLFRTSPLGIVARLEKEGLARVFTVIPETRRDLTVLDAGTAFWPVPSLAMVAGTTLATAFGDRAAAIVYLGPPSSMTASRLSPALCADSSYIEMRLRRLNLIAPPPGAALTWEDRLKEACGVLRSSAPILDRNPEITNRMRVILAQAARGKLTPDGIAPESRERVISLLERDGPRFHAPAGELRSLTLVSDEEGAGKRVRRYRSDMSTGSGFSGRLN